MVVLEVGVILKEGTSIIRGTTSKHPCIRDIIRSDSTPLGCRTLPVYVCGREVYIGAAILIEFLLLLDADPHLLVRQSIRDRCLFHTKGVNFACH